ncbi:hypothetical protein N7499_002741 [Penicillium canescens]|nr:hypothetical protein N7499_002741 [Penicillium canescens]KAJ6166356.1 hypothetical protein N7485_009600 [Penicillium canescens]
MAMFGLLATICLVAFATATSQSGNNKLQAYSVPSEVILGSSFDVSLHVHGGKPESLGTYQVPLHEINTTTGAAITHLSSMAYFDFSGTVQVSIRYNTTPIKGVRIRPDSYDITPTVHNGTITFTLTQPRSIVVQVNDDIFDCLHLIGNPIEADVPAPTDPDIIYFGPGYHTVDGGVLNVSSGQTVYLAGGAALAASINFSNSSNASIRGRGVIYKPSSGISVVSAQNITIDGITFINTKFNVAQADGVTIKDIRSFSGTQWGDGMDFYCSKNVLVTGAFMRNSDDCVAIYNHRDDFYGDSENITIENSSLWADVAHPINIGTHGNTDNPETISDIVIRNIDILDHREMQVLYQGCIAVNPGDGNLVRNLLIEDVRVEDFRMGQLINMRVMFNTDYNTSPGRGISNVTIRNLNYNGVNANTSILVGYDDSRSIEDVTFQNLTINGKIISDAMKKPRWYLTTDFIPAYANEHVKNLNFLQ